MSNTILFFQNCAYFLPFKWPIEVKFSLNRSGSINALLITRLLTTCFGFISSNLLREVSQFLVLFQVSLFQVHHLSELSCVSLSVSQLGICFKFEYRSTCGIRNQIKRIFSLSILICTFGNNYHLQQLCSEQILHRGFH